MAVEHKNAVLGQDYFPVYRGFHPDHTTLADEGCHCLPPANGTSDEGAEFWSNLTVTECKA
jgi:hypothetical protein